MRQRGRGEETSPLTGQDVSQLLELPGGGVTLEAFQKGHYQATLLQVIEEVKEEASIRISLADLPLLPPWYHFTFNVKAKKPGEEDKQDLAAVVVITIDEPAVLAEGLLWVSPNELKALADEGRFVPGKDAWGKRMCCMALAALTHSSNPVYAATARDYLAAIQAAWSK